MSIQKELNENKFCHNIRKDLLVLLDRFITRAVIDNGYAEVMSRGSDDPYRQLIDQECVKAVYPALRKNCDQKETDEKVFMEAQLLYLEFCISKGFGRPTVFLPSEFPEEIREFYRREYPVGYCEDQAFFGEVYGDFFR